VSEPTPEEKLAAFEADDETDDLPEFGKNAAELPSVIALEDNLLGDNFVKASLDAIVNLDVMNSFNQYDAEGKLVSSGMEAIQALLAHHGFVIDRYQFGPTIDRAGLDSEPYPSGTKHIGLLGAEGSIFPTDIMIMDSAAEVADNLRDSLNQAMTDGSRLDELQYATVIKVVDYPNGDQEVDEVEDVLEDWKVNYAAEPDESTTSEEA